MGPTQEKIDKLLNRVDEIERRVEKINNHLDDTVVDPSDTKNIREKLNALSNGGKWEDSSRQERADEILDVVGRKTDSIVAILEEYEAALEDVDT